MMKQEDESYRSARTESLTAVELPYGEGKYSMRILLPEEGTSPWRLADTLDTDDWRRLTRRMHSEELRRLWVPTFELRYKKELKDVLKALGMERAFRGADFLGMADITFLHIDRVRHKTYLEINESGTEASAATAVQMGVARAEGGRDRPSMVVDRPFVVAIREHQSGAILFLGVVMNPAS